MRIRTALLVGATLPYLSGCAGINPPSHAGQATPQGQAMQHMIADVDQVRAFVYGSGSQSEAENAAGDLVSWSRRLADLFPPGQASVEYVDMSPQRARDAPVAMSKAADLLLAEVKTGNRTAIGDQLVQTERTGCGSCHLSGSH